MTTANNRKIQRIGLERNALQPDGRDIQFDSKHCHGIRISIPYSGKLSKNNLHKVTRGMYWDKETIAVRETIGWKIKSLRHTFFKGKIWLKIFVQKPNGAGDAINVLDVIADAVKDAIGVDDRWFSLESLDWQIVKEDPVVFIWVKQEANEPQELCSVCGGIFSLTDFLPMIQRRATAKERLGQAVCALCRKGSARVLKQPPKCKGCGKPVVKRNGRAGAERKTGYCRSCLPKWIANRKRVKGQFVKSKKGRVEVKIKIK